ncbi:hypothetical protein BIV24_23915 [Streptomyces colonosanans]|uniref:HTH luxR-type domain-containing protein n=1 Tax=Streptomyces colonosanans TaxID=1428652 RepID=A0A1S2P2E1_9ACTN|nr:hypothetical protein BIV24_23915 [Streptomyces colonosanans]
MPAHRARREPVADGQRGVDRDRHRLAVESWTVLRALGSGATDETAARELGMSLRTCRRRVAEPLDVLGASSRFQAGVRAGELGLNG